jgi:hypothetical protein
MLLGGGAGMTSDSDDLAEQLRQNLKVRRELAAEVAKAKGANKGRGIATAWVGSSSDRPDASGTWTR